MSIFSCSSLQTNSAGLTIAYSVNLPPILNETSGLVCDESGIYTINDSGNAPVIYQLDQQGNIQHQITLSSSNTDWEALTKDEDGFYIGEFGNNAGKRTKLSVIKVASTAISNQRYVLVGYQVMAWRVSPFIATLDETFTVTHIERLLGLGQVEGVCAYQGDVWITQEKLGFSRAKLVKTSL